MPDFAFTALAQNGQRNQGTLTANSEREVMSMLDSRGMFPLQIDLIKSAATAKGGFRGRVKARHMANFYSQLANLLRAGVPLLRSLTILEKQSSQPALSDILREVHIKVADGTMLADAMMQHSGAFTELAVSMVRAGEEGGFLEDVLERIASFTEHQEDLKAKVIGALAYPIFLAVMGLIVLNVLVIVFVPMFEPIFKKLDEKGALPTLTVALIAVSHLMQGWWWLVLIGCTVGFIVFRNWARTDSGRLSIDSIRLKLPGAGNIYLSLAISRFTRILGTLLKNGIPILQALRIGKDSTGNKVLTNAIDKAADNVTAGNKLAAPLTACPYFPRDVVEMVAVGEESNQLEKVLIDIADGLEKRTSRQLELFVRLLEPVMLLVMAGITLIVVAGLLLPVFKMSQAVQ
ncbi:MAG: type II secretion system F family protein [Gemmataceae bacterium]|nr:type II secretion system F family protein [Gemmataceae bacterium]MCI0740170.1 type II secretion system F family protein [Gemmataceae bacterium]